ncbi:MAG: hypothetical protein ACREJC_16665 [Tepidisphaeraceae bacterium]
MLNDNAVIVEGHVIAAKRTLQPAASQYLFFFIPTSVSTENPRYDATIAIDRVLKGTVQGSTIELSNYRALTAEENAAFVDGYGIHINSVLRVGYDQRHGERLTALVIVPLGNTPEFDEALRQAAMLRARRSSMRPASRASGVSQ